MTATTDAPATKELTFTRLLDAPRALVFRAWTDPDMLAQWWGPKGFTNPVCELHTHIEGEMFILMRGPDGAEYPMKGKFTEVVPPERLTFLAVPLGEDGRPRLEATTTVTFAEQDGKTLLTVHAHARALHPAGLRMLEGMEPGWRGSLDKLAALFA